MESEMTGKNWWLRKKIKKEQNILFVNNMQPHVLNNACYDNKYTQEFPKLKFKYHRIVCQNYGSQ